MAKWKPGQLVTLWNKVYQIKKSDKKQQYKICSFCQMENVKPPCIEARDYPDRPDGFGFADCVLNTPIGCFPKLVKPKQ